LIFALFKLIELKCDFQNVSEKIKKEMEAKS